MSASQYTAEMFAQFKLRAAWPPNLPIALGVIGELDSDGQFGLS